MWQKKSKLYKKYKIHIKYLQSVAFCNILVDNIGIQMRGIKDMKKLIIYSIIIFTIMVTGFVYGQELTEQLRCGQLDVNGMRAAAMYNQMGVEAQQAGDNSQAIESYTCAINEGIEYYAPYYNRGIAYFHNGEYQLAADDLWMAVDYAPNQLPEFYYALGMIYDSMGDIESAIIYYQRCLDLDIAPNLAIAERIEKLQTQ